ncbi:MAG: hypothetical protein WC516_06945 [Patescibacteria group bacterium]|jgi:hypothetical protein
MNDLHDRFKFHQLNEKQIKKCSEVRGKALEYAEMLVLNCPEGRELSLALTKLEEVVFWANAGIAREKQLVKPVKYVEDKDIRVHMVAALTESVGKKSNDLIQGVLDVLPAQRKLEIGLTCAVCGKGECECENLKKIVDDGFDFYKGSWECKGCKIKVGRMKEIIHESNCYVGYAIERMKVKAELEKDAHLCMGCGTVGCLCGQ